MSHAPRAHVQVFAPARLHFGFLDLHGGFGRRFGGLGVSLEEIGTEIEATLAAEVSAAGPDADRARSFAEEFIRAAGLPAGVRLEVRRAIPGHAGLGSGTQMALAVGTALCRLHGLPHSTGEVALLLGRGRRSGVGIGLFSQGGAVLDAGRGPATHVPPVIARVPVPEAWRFLLVLDPRSRGLAGQSEEEAFRHLHRMSESVSGEICRIALMQVLPALAEADCAAFGAGVTRIQERVGECFAEAQHGQFSSVEVERALARLRDGGAAGIGQSSWGPTGFAIFPSETAAFQALRALRAAERDAGALDFVSCRARNAPADVRAESARAGRSRRR